MALIEIQLRDCTFQHLRFKSGATRVNMAHRDPVLLQEVFEHFHLIFYASIRSLHAPEVEVLSAPLRDLYEIPDNWLKSARTDLLASTGVINTSLMHSNLLVGTLEDLDPIGTTYLLEVILL